MRRKLLDDPTRLPRTTPRLHSPSISLFFFVMLLLLCLVSPTTVAAFETASQGRYAVHLNEVPLHPADDGLRTMRKTWPKALQHWIRDSGFGRAFLDATAIPTLLPSLLQEHPTVIADFVRLSGGSQDVSFQTLRYGSHPRQCIDVIDPATTKTSDPSPRRRLVIFVHGGAWGSGFPALYRLVAQSFPESTVALVGYRTYPTTNVNGQVEDVQRAVEALQKQYHGMTTTLLGHSSGAHIASLALLRGRVQVDRWIGLSGVYHIPRHYRYERTRGVERISPLAPACGLYEWKRQSPTVLAKTQQDVRLPPLFLGHGQNDTTVPYASSVDFAQSVPSSTLHVWEGVEHAEVVLQLMFGGPVREAVRDWLEETSSQETLTVSAGGTEPSSL